MARVWLWNSLPTRCRSISDVFLDSGLGILKAHLEARGHRIHIVDWAHLGFFSGLGSMYLSGPLRLMYKAILRLPSWSAKPIGLMTLPLQALLRAVQTARMRRRILSLAEEFVASGDRVFGIKVWYGEAYQWSKELAGRILCLDPSAMVVAGGYHATLYEEDILADSRFDLAVVSEGEFALARILEVADQHRANWDKAAVLAELRSLAVGGELPNVLLRDGNTFFRSCRTEYHMDRKALPDYRGQEKKTPIHVLVESVGCPWGQCSFCVHRSFSRHYRPRPIRELIREMRSLAGQGVATFRLAESDVPVARGKKLAEAILSAGLQVEYVMGHRATCGARNKHADLMECYKLMIRSGLRAVFIGGETGCDTVNDRVMNKGVCRDDLVGTMSAIRTAREETGLKCDIILSMIYPVPTMGLVKLDDVFNENIALVEEGRPDVVQPNPPAPIKGARWFDEAEAFGFSLGDDFLRSVMSYEYCLCKPTSMWPALDVGLEGRGFHEIMAECDRFRKAVEARGFATNMSDAHCVVARAAGYESTAELFRFKEENFLALASCDYTFFRKALAMIGQRGRSLARSVREYDRTATN